MAKRLDKNAKFWIYIVPPNLWNNLDVKNMSTMATYDSVGAKKNDIIIFYVKGKGFSGMCKLSSDQRNNNENLVIFRDKNFNKVIFDMEYFYPFIDIITISSVINYIKSDRVGFKNIVSFRNKFLAGTYKINSLDNDKGVILYKIMVDKLDTDKQVKKTKKTSPIKTNSKENLRKKSHKSSGSIKSNESNESNKHISSSSESIFETKSSKSKNASDITSDDIPITSDRSNETLDNDLDYGRKGRVYYIPIMVSPCKNFLFPDDDEIIDYVIDHFKKCDKCEWTNNNNIEFHSVFDTARVEFMEVDEDDDEFDDALAAYQSLKKYKFEHNFKRKNVVQIMHIIEDDVYDDCLLLCWSGYY